MADIRIKDLPTTASLTASDDFIAIDGTTNGTRKLSAANPSVTTLTTSGVIAPGGSVHGANGTAANPSFAFLSNQNTGLYRIGLDNIGVAANGAKVLDIATTGLTVTGAVTVGTGAAVGGATAGAGGLAFPATAVAVADANTLDDYEEGTWTGTMTGGTTAPITPVTATGKYTKIGNVVTVIITFNNKDTTGAIGQLLVTGLPFTSTSSINQIGSVGVYGLSIPNKTLNTWITASTTTIEFISAADNGAWSFPSITAGANKYAHITATYLV